LKDIVTGYWNWIWSWHTTSFCFVIHTERPHTSLFLFLSL